MSIVERLERKAETKGLEKKGIEVALKMLTRNYSLEEISLISGLSSSEVLELSKKHKKQ